MLLISFLVNYKNADPCIAIILFKIIIHVIIPVFQPKISLLLQFKVYLNRMQSRFSNIIAKSLHENQYTQLHKHAK